MTRPSIHDCELMELPRIYDPGGNITPLHGGEDLPFEIRRGFYLYDIPRGESPGAHAHKLCHQLIVAAAGAVGVFVAAGGAQRVVTLNRPYYGLHVLPGIWASQREFSSSSICLVLASERYDENDYIRDYDDFLRFTQRL